MHDRASELLHRLDDDLLSQQINDGEGIAEGGVPGDPQVATSVSVDDNFTTEQYVLSVPNYPFVPFFDSLYKTYLRAEC